MQVSENAASTSLDDSSLSLHRMLEPEVLADPHRFYNTLREHDPVHWDPYMHAWVVTSYAEVVTVMMSYLADRTPEPEYLDRLGLDFMKPFAAMMKQQMMFRDAGNHARLRNICAAAFTPRKVEELRDVIEKVAIDLIDRFIRAGEFEMVVDFANPLPAIVTARLLGVPQEDHHQLHAWVVDIAEVLGNFQLHPGRVEEIQRSLESLRQYVAAKVEEQRVKPNGGLIDALITAEADGNRLTTDEVIANTIITLIGGHETTTNLIASGFSTLLRQPESFEMLRSRPEIVTSAVEELLRFESPVQHTVRLAPADAQLGNRWIKKGARVVAVFAAANRDPKRFPEPNRLDLLRTDNRHVAFGWAAHFCFGAPLARLEGQVAFNVLLRRLKNPALLTDELSWRENAGLRGLNRLKVRFDPASE